MRSHGFESPHNAMQISTWVLLPALIIHFALFVTTTLPIGLSIPLSIIYFSLAIASAHYTYVTTKTDSMDERLYEHLRNEPHPNALKKKAEAAKKKEELVKKKEEVARKKAAIRNKGAESADDTNETHDEEDLEDPEEEEEPEEEVKYCWVCQTEVHVQSMHCKYCDKCVSNFDHHCMWLNTCIGSENYATFFRTVWCLTLLTITHVIALTLYLIGYFMRIWGIRERSEWIKEDCPEIIMGINLGVGVFTLLVVGMVMQLLVFHQELQRDGLTTYQFIMKDSQVKREKAIISSRVKERRQVELTKIENEGGSFFEKTSIQMGGMKVCRPCDPVRKGILEEKGAAENLEVSPPAADGSGTDEEFLETPSGSRDEKFDTSKMTTHSA